MEYLYEYILDKKQNKYMVNKRAVIYKNDFIVYFKVPGSKELHAVALKNITEEFEAPNLNSYYEPRLFKYSWKNNEEELKKTNMEMNKQEKEKEISRLKQAIMLGKNRIEEEVRKLTELEKELEELNKEKR